MHQALHRHGRTALGRYPVRVYPTIPFFFPNHLPSLPLIARTASTISGIMRHRTSEFTFFTPLSVMRQMNRDLGHSTHPPLLPLTSICYL